MCPRNITFAGQVLYNTPIAFFLRYFKKELHYVKKFAYISIAIEYNKYSYVSCKCVVVLIDYLFCFDSAVDLYMVGSELFSHPFCLYYIILFRCRFWIWIGTKMGRIQNTSYYPLLQRTILYN